MGHRAAHASIQLLALAITERDIESHHIGAGGSECSEQTAAVFTGADELAVSSHTDHQWNDLLDSRRLLAAPADDVLRLARPFTVAVEGMRRKGEGLAQKSKG